MHYCHYKDPYILFKGTTTIAAVPPPGVDPDNNNKEVAFKNCVPFTNAYMCSIDCTEENHVLLKSSQ